MRKQVLYLKINIPLLYHWSQIIYIVQFLNEILPCRKMVLLKLRFWNTYTLHIFFELHIILDDKVTMPIEFAGCIKFRSYTYINIFIIGQV